MNTKKIIKAFIPPAIVILIHLILFSFDLYNKLPWIDIPMHLAGGAAVAFTFTYLIKTPKNKNRFPIILSLVFLTAIAWEFAEFTSDLLINSTLQEGTLDTISDIIFGLIGIPAGYLASQQTDKINPSNH